MDSLMAKALKSQLGDSHKERAKNAKKRTYKPYLCSVPMCAKVIKRPHNHLKQTHKITNKKIYERYLRHMKPYKIIEEETEDESSETTDDSDDTEDERRSLKKIIRSERQQTYEENSDSSDEDWVQSKMKELSKKKRVKKRKFRNNLSSI